MGTDIHWMVERLDADGAWHGTMSKPRAFQIESSPETLGLDQKQARRAMAIGYRDYERFAILSGLPDMFPDQDDKLAEDGFPHDISRAAVDMFAGDSELHSLGHFRLGELRRFVSERNGNLFPSPETLAVGQDLLNDVEALVGDETLMAEILDGPPYGEDFETRYPRMGTSNHARLARIEAARMLLPIDGDTLRFLIAYDN